MTKRLYGGQAKIMKRKTTEALREDIALNGTVQLYRKKRLTTTVNVAESE